MFMRDRERHAKMETSSVSSDVPPVERTQAESEVSPYKIAMSIADQLGETEEETRETIFRIVKTLGRTQAWALLTQTLEVEKQGGMMLPREFRRRTSVGIFFHLAFTTGITKEGKRFKRFYPKDIPSSLSSSPPKTPSAPKKAQPPLQWEYLRAVIAEINTVKGRASTVKITLIGTVDTCVDKGTYVVASMQSSEIPPLPTDLPAPSENTTTYIVYIASRQWKTVAETVKDAEDALIIEGYPQTDPQTDAISVFATSVTSKKLQAAKQQISVEKKE